MNNKGQTLVLFVILIPALIFVFISLYQVGSIKIEEKAIKGSIEEALEYGINNLESESLYINIKEMITSSCSKIADDDIKITIGDNEINIVVSIEYETFIINDKVIFDYTGTVEEGKLKIVENRG